MIAKFWPWTRAIERIGTEAWKRQRRASGVLIGNPEQYEREFVVYRVTNRWTGSVTLKKVYLDK